MAQKYYAIHFNYLGVPQCIAIEKEALEKDANGVDDFWGEFMLNGKAYQFQIYYGDDLVSVNVFLKDGTEILGRYDAVITRYIIGQPIYKGKKNKEKPTILF